MKLAVFSNLWPPVFIGGYEIGASHIVAELRRRGHEVLVLSAHQYHLIRPGYYESRRHQGDEREGIVDTGLCVFGDMLPFMNWHRWKFLRGFFQTWAARRRYLKALHAFRPDALLCFNPLGVLASVLDDFVAYAREHDVPLNAYVSDHWVAGWPGGHPMPGVFHHYLTSPSRSTRFRCKVFRKFLYWLGMAPDHMPLIDHYFYCSRFIQELSRPGSVAVARHSVVHWGLPAIHAVEPPAGGHFEKDEPLTLVYAGQILEHKGLPTVLRALARCRARHRLVVIGDDQIDYASKCKEIAANLGVLDRIDFVGRKKPEDMLRLLREVGQALVVPSMWDEPFSIVVLEGMGVGLPVLATRTGGTPEAIVHGENGFLFERGDARQLAALIDQLEGDRGLCRQVGARARSSVLERFTMEKMVDQLLGHMGESKTRLSERPAA